jgi:hypothetical protein
MACIRDYDFHPPDEVRLFPMPTSGVRRLDDEAFVAEVRYGDIEVRHYAFRDHWFKVNCTTDPAGAFVNTTSPATYRRSRSPATSRRRCSGRTKRSLRSTSGSTYSSR